MKQVSTHLTSARKRAATHSRVVVLAAMFGALAAGQVKAHERTQIDLTGIISSPAKINNIDDILGLGMDGANPYPALLHNGALVRLPVNLASTTILSNRYKLNNSSQVMYWVYTNGTSGDISTRIFDANTGATVDLGKIAGYTSTFGEGFNDNGDVVGVARSATGDRPFLWRNGQFSQLAPLASAPAGASYTYSFINNHGHVMGSVSINGVITWLIWRNGLPSIFPQPTPADSGVSKNDVRAFNDRDEVLTVYYDNMAQTRNYHVLTQQTPPIVDYAPGEITVEAFGFNNSGNVLERTRDTLAGHFGTDFEYFIEGGMGARVPDYPRQDPAYDINDNVDVLGTSYLGNGVFRDTLYKVLPAPIPQIVGLTPDRTIPGAPTMPLTINGANFDPDSTVLLNGVAQDSSHYLSATQMRVVLPATSLARVGTVSVQVVTRAPGGGSSAIRYFNIAVPRPTLTTNAPIRIAPSSFPYEITLDGLDFDPGAMVTINDTTTLTPTFVSPYQIKVTVPTNITGIPGSYFVRVVNPGWSNASNPVALNVQFTLPPIASMSPTRIPAGLPSQSLYILGSFNYPSTVKVSFNNGAPVTPTTIHSAQIYVPIPAYVLAHPGDYTVRVVDSFANGGATPPVTLSVVQRPTLTSLTPGSVKAGSGAATITLTGTNFEAMSTITVNNGTPIPATFVSATKLTAVIPTSVTGVKGGYSVRVVNAGYANFSNPQGFNVTP